MNKINPHNPTNPTDFPAYFPWGLPVTSEAMEALSIAPPENARATLLDEPDMMTMRRIADALTKQQPNEPVTAGTLLIAGTICDLLRWIANYYAFDQEPGITTQTLAWLDTRENLAGVTQTVNTFIDLYPPRELLNGKTREEFLDPTVNPTSPPAERVFWEAAILAIITTNPAMAPMRRLYDDHNLRREVQYTTTLTEAETYLTGQPEFSPLKLPIFEALRAPLNAHPNSLEDQLEFILEKWADALPQSIVRRMRIARGILREETATRGLGPGPAVPLEFGPGAHGSSAHSDEYPEPERFSTDANWMSDVTMLAKSAYVWLDQLSKEYKRPIHTFDQVPNEELDRLARSGFNCVWLIGVWERSIASEWIKKRMGNPDAVASAYSLYDYDIAADLGGHDAYINLRDRAAERGVRLASDMVPNHVGIHSKWVIEHPDWFIQQPYSPYPSYQFNGPDVSPDPRVTVQIEDGYWDHSDAAVVFKRTDTHTGEARYIYHGNDGTSMPWNDTAQLDYLNPAVREAVIQTILHVARMFPVIRFDAAMTLAKKHFQRLWFPKMGDEGAVPSRAEHGMSREQFDAAMPEEFWREVVDRIQKECPDTLLLAEAFWLMEGYFVRTLGMHRVYNSAFMNMLKMEENEKYRLTIKNVLEFSPQILKRFVNFMSNPDEKTAVEQFGKDDKYFGCCVLLSTLPGLPMYAHGQIEGYTEKYGMEYRKAYWEEQPDQHLIRRHEREIFPLLRQRYLFSGAENFTLFDFYTDHGHVDENVFAYTNRSGDQRSLVIYNNAFNNTTGSMRTAAAINRGTAELPRYEHPELTQALALETAPRLYWLFRDHRDGLQYIRSSQDLQSSGLRVTLHAYQYHVFLDWQAQSDTDGSWRAICAHLDGRGVPNIDLERRRLIYSPLIDNFRALLTPKLFDTFDRLRKGTPESKADLNDILHDFLEEVSHYTTAAYDEDALIESIQDELDDLWAVAKKIEELPDDNAARLALENWFVTTQSTQPEKPASTKKVDTKSKAKTKPSATPVLKPKYGPWTLPALWILLGNVGEAFVGTSRAALSASWLDDWLLTPAIGDALMQIGRDQSRTIDDAELIISALEHIADFDEVEDPIAFFNILLTEERLSAFLQLHEWDRIHYIKKEQLERLTDWIIAAQATRLTHDATISSSIWTERLETLVDAASKVTQAADTCGYRVEEIKAYVATPPLPTPEQLDKQVDAPSALDTPTPKNTNRDRR